jgi:hypothetical protein
MEAEADLAARINGGSMSSTPADPNTHRRRASRRDSGTPLNEDVTCIKSRLPDEERVSGFMVVSLGLSI